MNTASLTEITAVDSFVAQIPTVRKLLHQVIVGQDEVLDQLLICALSGSHALLVGAPGLAKTLMVKSLANVFHWRFSRVQFTPDLMPSETSLAMSFLDAMAQSGEMSMQFRKGPRFCQSNLGR